MSSGQQEMAETAKEWWDELSDDERNEAILFLYTEKAYNNEDMRPDTRRARNELNNMIDML